MAICPFFGGSKTPPAPWVSPQLAAGRRDRWDGLADLALCGWGFQSRSSGSKRSKRRAGHRSMLHDP